MKIIYNNILPLPGFCAMMLFGFIMARKKYAPLPAHIVNHEEIHRMQADECGGYVKYYRKYLQFWLEYGYRDNPFEREARTYMYDSEYTAERQPRAWREWDTNHETYSGDDED